MGSSLFQGWGKNILSNYKGSHDVEVVCALGKKIGLHKVALALYSSLLGEVLLNMEEEEKLVIILPNFPATLVKMCVALMYEGEVALKNQADYVRVDVCLSNMLGVNMALHKFGVQLDNPNHTRGTQNKSSDTQEVEKRQINLDANSTGLLSQPDKIVDKSPRHSDEIVEKSLNRQGELLQKSSRKLCNPSPGITRGAKEPRHIENIENEKSVKVESETQPRLPKETQNNHKQGDEVVLCTEKEISVPATKAENKDDSLFLMLDHFEEQEGGVHLKDLGHRSRDVLETDYRCLLKKGEGIYHFKPEPMAEPKLEFDPLGAETFLLKSLLLKDKHERDKTRLELVKRQKKLSRIKRRVKRNTESSTLINTNEPDFTKVELKKEIFSCHSCDFETTKVRRLERHQRREHRLFPQKKTKKQKEKKYKIIDAPIKTEKFGPKVFSCKDCKYSTTNSFNLKRHEDNVHKGLLHKCDVDGCDYSNSQPGNVAGHKKVTKEHKVSNRVVQNLMLKKFSLFTQSIFICPGGTPRPPGTLSSLPSNFHIEAEFDDSHERPTPGHQVSV